MAIADFLSARAPQIRRLPASVVNKIAAGEVIERPASVVKELVENALDAGATRIDVAVEQGGVELVRVVDNGCGIAPDDLPLAVASHATSKLECADDLFRVRTLGFRGEALASIAEISRFVLRSRTAKRPGGAEQEGAAELEVVAGELGPVTPCAGPPGTLIEVRNLFFNTPVRRKFLRSTPTEVGHISEALTRLALAYPEVHFQLRHNGRQIYDLPPTDDWCARVGEFFGHELVGDLLWVESRDSDIILRGYVGHPSQSRSHNRMQYLFLNGRHIRDRALQHALSEAYRGLLLTGRYPISFLWLEMPPELVDVNVHPTKLEVRFQDGGRLYSQVLGTLRTRFLTADLNHRLAPTSSASSPVSPSPFSPGLPASSVDSRPTPFDPPVDRSRELVDWVKQQAGSWMSAPTDASAAPPAIPTAPMSSRPMPAGPITAASLSSTPQLHEPLGLVPLERAWQPVGLETSDEPALDGPMASVGGPAWSGGTAPPALQVHQKYLVAETPEGLVVIDQHALHERILYEQLREKVLAGALETQALLVPEPVDLAPAEAAAVLAVREVLTQLGVRVEPFGGSTVLVASYPAMLRQAQPADMLRSIVERLMAGGKTPERRDLLDELLHLMSCKAAVKAGDPLSPAEVDALVAQRHLAQDAHHCPHGRPTALVFTREDLDKQFKRT